MDEYDLRQSAKFLGELYPILLDRSGHKISDGEHRKRARGKWHTVRLKQIDSKEKLLAARIAANCARRQVSFSESQKWVNELASQLDKDGHVAVRIAQMTGMDDHWVRERLSNEFKTMTKSRTTNSQNERRFAEDAPQRNDLLKRELLIEGPPPIPQRQDKGQFVLEWWKKTFETFPELSAISDLDEIQKNVMRKALPKLRTLLEAWEKALGREPIEAEVN